MAIIRIEANDSGTINFSSSAQTTPGGVSIPSQGISRTQNQRYTNRNTPYDFRPFFTFPQTDISVLENAVIHSMQIGVTIATLTNRNNYTFFITKQRIMPNWATVPSGIAAGLTGLNVSAIYPPMTLPRGRTWDIQSLDNLKNILNNSVIFSGYESYNGSLSLYSETAQQEYRPYIEVDYTPFIPEKPTTAAVSPHTITIDNLREQPFSWTYNQIDNIPQSHVDIQISTDGGTSWTYIVEKQPTTNQTYNIPANTLPSGTIRWRVRTWATTDRGGQASSDWSGSIYFGSVAGNTVSPTVQSVYPNNISLNITQPITFRWAYSQAYGYPQSHVDLQYNNGSAWVNILNKVATTSESYTVAADYFPGALVGRNIQWRVRVYTNITYGSSFSTAKIFSLVASTPPIGRVVSPNGSTIDNLKRQPFTWSYSQANNSPQSHVDIQISQDSGATWTDILTKYATTAQTYNIPANTLPEGLTRWRVRVWTNNGNLASGWSAGSLFRSVIGNTISPSVTAVSPSNIVLNTTNEITFRWNYTQPYGYVQSHVTLQYNNGSAWVNILDKAARSSNFYTIPPNYLPNDIPAGNVRWRVMAYVNTNYPSFYSNEASFTLISGASQPVITLVTESPEMTVNWTSAEQYGYRVRIFKYNSSGSENMVHDSGEKDGDNKFYNYKYLDDGDYRVEVAIVNSFGYWSSYAQEDFTVSNTSPGSIELTSNTTCFAAVELYWTTETEYQGYFVIRDNKPIAYVTNTVNNYTDYNANNKSKYYIKGVYDSNYTNSNIVYECINVKNAQLNIFGTDEILLLKMRAGGRPIHDEVVDSTVTYQAVEGRIHPLAFRSINQTNIHTFEFSFKNREDYEKILYFNNKNVVYKDCKGHRVVGNLEIGNINHSFTININFKITVIDVGEYLNYADY